MKFNNQTTFYHGKVRDVYGIGDDLLVMIASNRISAFDVILPREIPYKGQVLNQIAFHHLHQTADIVPNWLISSPLPNVSVGKRCEPFKVEMVVRGYLAGHAARTYKSGVRTLCGVTLPDGLKENQKLPTPIITPTTKADVGHDIDISKEEIINQSIVSKEHYEMLEKYALALFERGTELAAKQGLILVDTKYEFGLLNGEITLMDEIHTPDSSRYFISEGYSDCILNDKEPKQLSKEFVRQWLIENNFSGQVGQSIPVMDDEKVIAISNRYIELYELITGEKFNRAPFLQDSDIEKAVDMELKKIALNLR
jgi:phosphoribosylaminoimidazole-succinocarboxamide synthase